VVVLGVLAKMLGQIGDTLRQKGYLDFRGSGVSRTPGVLLDNFCFLYCG